MFGILKSLFIRWYDIIAGNQKTIRHEEVMYLQATYLAMSW
jgi:hypothetical protein